MTRTLACGLLLLVVPACASAPTPRNADAPAEAAASHATSDEQRRSAMRIGPEEIQAARFANAYDLVQAHRPRWLRVRAINAREMEVVRVVIDGRPAGGVDVLQDLPLTVLRELEFRDAVDATQEGAHTHLYAGTIRVTTNRR